MKRTVNHMHSAPTIDKRAPESDAIISGGGSVFVGNALSQAAKDWVSENISEVGFNPDLPNRVYVEHHYISDVVSGMRRAGLEVR